jgi:T-complex protein 1 subunit alpha
MLFFYAMQEHAQLKNCGLDLYEGVVRDNKKAGVFEPAISKVGTLSFKSFSFFCQKRTEVTYFICSNVADAGCSFRIPDLYFFIPDLDFFHPGC